jgi:hypothetical protein
MLEKLSQSNIKVPVVVRSHYVAVDEHGRKITSSTGTGDWIHFFLFVLFVLLVLLMLFVLVLSFSWLTDLAKLVCCLSISANFCLVFSTVET